MLYIYFKGFHAKRVLCCISPLPVHRELITFKYQISGLSVLQFASIINRSIAQRPNECTSFLIFLCRGGYFSEFAQIILTVGYNVEKNFWAFVSPTQLLSLDFCLCVGECHYLLADLPSMFSSRNFHLCLHMANISDLLFNDVLFSASKMWIFSAMHKLQFFDPAT